MDHLLLLVIHLCIAGTLSQTVIRGTVGKEITLPCTYSVRGGQTHMCWGRGSCPNSKCSDEILKTDGMRVTSRASSRYQLRGWIAGGDVSLTIANLKDGDKGMYCCRIEVPGWFNDLKKTLTLQVDRATSSSPTVPAVALLPVTHVSSTTTSSMSTLVALLTTSPLVNNTKSPSTSPQHECPENGSLPTPEAVASSTGTARVWKMLSQNYVAVSCAVAVLVLLLVLLVLIVKRKNMRLYQINETKSMNQVEETEKELIETEGENGIFAL